MRAIKSNSPAVTPESVFLEGGPHSLSGSVVVLAELSEVIYSPEKIKIRFENGYEHYEFSDQTADPLKLRWVGRTKIAE
ncbi:DUF5988 family protein [Streptomyces longisporoflavus]|uniref:DUF5988 family protein n=1 Tax=Streptomyces longisporoflavus TaxID=28044 RepID=A0ABW7QIF5_9ACTN